MRLAANERVNEYSASQCARRSVSIDECDREGHTKVLSGTKKERNQWGGVVVKGIRGQRYYESDYWPGLVPIY